jgi:hypothetical protein
VRRGVYRVLVGKPEGKDHLKDPGIDGRIILRWIFIRWVVGGLINLFQNRYRWQALVVKAVMNPPVPYNAGEFLE